jgi:hypothetical protein
MNPASEEVGNEKMKHSSFFLRLGVFARELNPASGEAG